MKKLIFIALLFIGFSASAQTTMPIIPETDTLTNADTLYKYLPKGIAGFDKLTIQPVITRVSGTMAGTSFFQASLDNESWYTIDSLVTTNQVTNTKLYHYAPPTYLYYRWMFITSGTVVGIPSITYWGRK